MKLNETILHFGCHMILGGGFIGTVLLFIFCNNYIGHTCLFSDYSYVKGIVNGGRTLESVECSRCVLYAKSLTISPQQCVKSETYSCFNTGANFTVNAARNQTCYMETGYHLPDQKSARKTMSGYRVGESYDLYFKDGKRWKDKRCIDPKDYEVVSTFTIGMFIFAAVGSFTVVSHLVLVATTAVFYRASLLVVPYFGGDDESEMVAIPPRIRYGGVVRSPSEDSDGAISGGSAEDGRETYIRNENDSVYAGGRSRDGSF